MIKRLSLRKTFKGPIVLFIIRFSLATSAPEIFRWLHCKKVFTLFHPKSLTDTMVFIPSAGYLLCQILILVSAYYVKAAVQDTHAGKQWTKAIIQKKAPYWEGVAVIDGEFRTLKLTDFNGKYLVFMFYPLDFTFVCPTEILAFNDRLPEFRELNADVVVCSVDSHFTHLAWTNTSRKDGGLGPIKIPMLSDLNKQISQDYGVYLPELGHTLRGLFIIDGQGILRQTTINDLPVGRSVDETLRLLQAFQYTDSHGEVCPANWKPGGETIIPDPIKKRSYFEKVNEDCSGH